MRRLLPLLLTVFLLPLADMASARWGYLQLADNAGLSRDEAVSRARSRQQGRVLSAEEGNDGSYRVRILTDEGRVRRLRVDPHDVQDDEGPAPRQRPLRR